MVEFFNAKMQECGLCTASGRPVITAQIDMEKNYAFLEVCLVEFSSTIYNGKQEKNPPNFQIDNATNL